MLAILGKLLGPIGTALQLAWPKQASSGDIDSIEAIEFLVQETKTKLNISEDDARKIVAGTIYQNAKEKGDDPNALYANLPPELKNAIRLTPGQLDVAQNITVVTTAGSVLGTLGTLVFGVITKNPSLIKIGGAGLLVALGMAANNINDVFVHGENYVQSAALESYKLEQKGKDLGVTNYGDFNSEEIDALLLGYQRGGGQGFKDPKTGNRYNLTKAETQTALSVIIGDFNAAGIGPTKDKVLMELRRWAIGPFKSALPQEAVAAGAAAKSTYTPASYTRVTTRSMAIPKLFLGVVKSGVVAKPTELTRQVDDKITDQDDLLRDVQTNVTNWLASLPGRLTYDIVISLNPNDELGVPKAGTWVVLNLFVTNQFHKRLLLDSILLGPLDPVVYYPQSTITKDISLSIPELLKIDKIKPLLIEDRAFFSVDTKGNVISAFAPAAADGASAAPAAAGGLAAPTSQPSAAAAASAAATVASVTPFVQKVTEQVAAQSQPPSAAPVAPAEPLISSWNEIRPLFEAAGIYDPPSRLISILGVGDTSMINEPGTYEKMYRAALAQGKIQPISKAPTSQYPKSITVNVDALMVRNSPHTSAPLAGSQRLVRGDKFTASGVTTGDSVDGENRWWISSLGHYVWVGGTAEKP